MAPPNKPAEHCCITTEPKNTVEFCAQIPPPADGATQFEIASESKTAADDVTLNAEFIPGAHSIVVLADPAPSKLNEAFHRLTVAVNAKVPGPIISLLPVETALL